MTTPDTEKGDPKRAIKDLLARLSLDLGALATRDALAAAEKEFLEERRVAGAHGFGYRR